ncbi:MAG: type II secretion system F family protein, partial [Planctomycetota bacterium]
MTSQRRRDELARDATRDEALSSSASGAPLEEVFLALAEETDDRRLQRSAAALAKQLRQGVVLAEALDTLSDRLPAHVHRALLSAAELGQPAAVIEGVSRHEASRRRLRRQVRSAMAYPVIVVGLLLLLLGLLSWFVVPQFAEVYDDFGLELPTATNAILAASRGMPWLFAAIAAAAAAYA